MNQLGMFHEDIYDSLRDVVRALGGFKKVAPLLFPAKNGNAESYLKDCLNTNRRETLDPCEVVLLLKWGKDVGCHSGIDYVCDSAGYKRTEPANPVDEQVELQRAWIESLKYQKQLVDRMEALQPQIRMVKS